jgi:putative ABC transport system permease protein
MLGGETREVIGILPEGVSYPIGLGPPADLYIPYIATPADRTDGRGFSMIVVGRLRPGVTVEQGRADIQRISTAVVLPLADQVVGTAKPWLFLVLAAVGCLLLLACFNVANLFLVRATTRARELAIREALGASRRRLAVGLLLEGLVLALIAGAAGVLVSFWGVQVAKSNLPFGLTRVSTIAVDVRIVAFSVVTAVVCGLVVAGVPAWFASRSDLVTFIKDSGGPIVGGRRRDRTLAAFLVADISIVCILLVATTLVVASFVFLTTADLGFDRRNVMRLDYLRYLTDIALADRPAANRALRADVLERTKAVPGVSAAAIVNGGTPLSGGGTRYSIIIPGFGETKGDNMLDRRAVTPDYFRVMGMQLIRGRLFDSSDRSGAPLVMLINDVASRRFFPDTDPVGTVVMFRGATTILGVLRGVRAEGPEGVIRPEMYTPLEQDQNDGAIAFGGLLVRTDGDPHRLANAVRNAVRPALSGEPDQPRVLDDYFRRVTAGRRFNAGVMAGFGVIAIMIGAIGVYGTMAFVVAQHVRSIGIRMALGASARSVCKLILGDALRKVTLGTSIGLIGAWTVSSLLRSFVFEIRPSNPAVYCAVAAFLALVGIIAALVPALRATRVDPLKVLRHQ